MRKHKQVTTLAALIIMSVSVIGCTAGHDEDMAQDIPFDYREYQEALTGDDENAEVRFNTRDWQYVETDAQPEDETVIEEIIAGAVDARDYADINNPVPLGQWVFYQEENWETGEYEPYYVRITGIGYDRNTIDEYLDTFKGSDAAGDAYYIEGYIYSWDSLINAGADVEFRSFDFEILYSPDYKAASWGISQNVEPSFRARPIDAEDFGLVEVGKGHKHSGIGKLVSLFRDELPKPGDLLYLHGVFPMIKSYAESDYVIYLEWYDGAKDDELQQILYFAAQ